MATLGAGAKLGPYEITGAIGAGGMGEVEAIWRRLSRQPKSRVQRGILC
jgi:hypothetical protein